VTFSQIEAGLPNGFHDAKILGISVDYLARTLQLTMRILIGTPGEANEEDYGPAELKVKGLHLFSVELPDPAYPFWTGGRPLNVSGDDDRSALAVKLPEDVSYCRFFVEEWNSFIHIAATSVEISS
jgi:hypothetical protein